jgi:hypothetical protein
MIVKTRYQTEIVIETLWGMSDVERQSGREQERRTY